MSSWKRLLHGKVEPLISVLYRGFCWAEYRMLCVKWFLKGGRKPDTEEQREVVQNVTFIYKSFERQYMAKNLFRSIQKYYPGVKVIIADDSKKSLDIHSPYLTVIQLPFNSGLSRSMNMALAQVETPYLVRLDDDQLLTPFSQIGKQINFLKKYPFVDLVGLLPCTTPRCPAPIEVAQEYFSQSMARAPKPLLIPHMTRIDPHHIVVGKSPNIFVAKTDQIKKLGWDDNIRMIDHKEFFIRAAGNLVSTIDISTVVFHYPNHFNRYYMNYRTDTEADKAYIHQKYHGSKA